MTSFDRAILTLAIVLLIITPILVAYIQVTLP
jgi:hypothetical protein